MTSTTVAPAGTTEIAPTGGVAFPVASRPQIRQSARATLSIINAGSYQPIQLPATGWVRKLKLMFTLAGKCGSAGAVVAGDGPWNLISGISLSDATGQPITQPVSGYTQYLLNKWLPGSAQNDKGSRWMNNPHAGPDFQYSVTGGTDFVARFSLEIELEQDYRTGYGCIPNLDSNASLQLNVNAAAITQAFSGTGITQADLSLVVEQHYWAPVGGTMGGVPTQTAPVGAGDFLETRYENQSIIAGAENTVPFTNRGGLIKGIICVSRNNGVRTAYGAGSNVGLVYDNNAVVEGHSFESFRDEMRRESGYLGADHALSYAPMSSPVGGLDTGVLVFNFDAKSEDRSTWLSTRVGTLLQAKVTPGAGATQFEIITQLMQVRDAGAFYGA